ncbi:MAG: ABC transporter ATP-binding protein [Armatimonadetes bacterium]|nr:ABC transporter ATP-binding protein [Armatimonadota bacterium]MDE2207737.1 ABC transporter ATP-binding protein [Armatimonadota bacterium]
MPRSASVGASLTEGQVQRRLLSYLRPQLTPLLGGLFCAAVTAAIAAGIARLIETAINAMMMGRVDLLDLLCALVVGVFVIKGVFTFGQSYLLALVANRVATRLRDEIFAHVHSLSLSFFHRRRTGAIMSVITNDVQVIQNAAMSLRNVVSAPITIVASVLYLFFISWRLAIASIIFIPFMAVVISSIGKRIRNISRTVQARLADVSTIMEETVAGVRVIQSFAAERHEVNRFVTENGRALGAVMKGARRSAQLRPLIELIGAFGIALVLFMGGNEVAHTIQVQHHLQQNWIAAHPAQPPPASSSFPVAGAMTEGALMAFLYLLNLMARSAGDIGGIATLRAQAMAGARRIFEEILDVESEVVQPAEPVRLDRISGHIEFQNVSFKYSPDGAPVLCNVSFEVRPGEVVALVGASGSGKSTIADLIPRFFDPVAGAIRIDGVDIRRLDLESLRKQIGIVPQETWLFAGTLRDNIKYGCRDAEEERVRAAAYAANASFINSMPQQLDTIVGERGIRLSGGERQRIAIARAILTDPRILILDEATSSLDASSEALVQEALDHLMQNRTTLVIAHRLSTVVNADRILAVREGAIVEAGTHAELLNAGGYYANLYETQVRTAGPTGA